MTIMGAIPEVSQRKKKSFKKTLSPLDISAIFQRRTIYCEIFVSVNSASTLSQRSQERSDAAEPEQDARSEEEAVAETEEERFQREEEELEKIIAQSESDQIKFQEELKTTETSIKQV